MEAPERSPTPHIGRNIARMREMLGVKQETLAHGLGISQQAVSKLEQSGRLEANRLKEIANVLGISADAIQHFNEEAAVYMISNHFRDETVQKYPCQFSPLARVITLYEALLKEKDKKIALLEWLLGSEEVKYGRDRQNQWAATLNQLLVTMITNHRMNGSRAVGKDQRQVR